MKPTHILLVLLTIMIWGSNFVVVKIGVQGVPPILFTALRFLFAALPMVFFIKRPAAPLHLVAGYAMFQFALQFTMLFGGIKLGFPPGLASLVIQLQVFFSIALASMMLGERTMLNQLMGAVLAMSGMTLVAAHMEATPTLIGFIMVALAGLSWALANIFTKKIGKVDPLSLVVWGSLLAFPPLLAASLIIEGPSAWNIAASRLNWVSIGAILYQSYPNTLVGYTIWSLLMRSYPTATIAPFTLLVPIVGMIFATVLLNEPLQWWKITACILVLAGLIFNQFGERWLNKNPLSIS